MFVNAQTPNPSNVVTATFNSVYTISNATAPSNINITSLDAWAVGVDGVITHWNGSKWNQVNTTITENIHSLWMVNSTSGWAVGGTLTTGSIYYYDGQNWTKWEKITQNGANNATIPATLNSVVTDANGATGWIVGGKGTVLKWDGAQWSSTTTLNLTLHSVSIAPDNSSLAYIVGDKGTILQWTGSVWNNVTSPTNVTLRSLVLNNATSGWAVGGDGNQGLIANLNSTGWYNWTRISFSTNTSAKDIINSTLNAVSFATPNAGWAVGGGGWMLFWDGNIWSGKTGVTSKELRGVSMAQNVTSGAWAVGDGGTLLYWNSTGWGSLDVLAIPEYPFAVPVLIVVLMVVLPLLLGYFAKKLRLQREFQKR